MPTTIVGFRSADEVVVSLPPVLVSRPLNPRIGPKLPTLTDWRPDEDANIVPNWRPPDYVETPRPPPTLGVEPTPATVEELAAMEVRSVEPEAGGGSSTKATSKPTAKANATRKAVSSSPSPSRWVEIDPWSRRQSFPSEAKVGERVAVHGYPGAWHVYRLENDEVPLVGSPSEDLFRIGMGLVSYRLQLVPSLLLRDAELHVDRAWLAWLGARGVDGPCWFWVGTLAALGGARPTGLRRVAYAREEGNHGRRRSAGRIWFAVDEVRLGR